MKIVHNIRKLLIVETKLYVIVITLVLGCLLVLVRRL